MTRENAKDFLPLIQALADGKDLIVNCGTEMAESWEVYTDNLGSLDSFPIKNIKIKPEKYCVWENYETTEEPYRIDIYNPNTSIKKPCCIGTKEACEEWIAKHGVQYVPFDTVEELIDCWHQKMFDGKPIYNTELEMPLISVKNKLLSNSMLLLVGFENNCISINGCYLKLEDLFEYYTFLDGTPIGKIKE